jgi:hypothetical protein
MHQLIIQIIHVYKSHVLIIVLRYIVNVVKFVDVKDVKVLIRKSIKWKTRVLGLLWMWKMTWLRLELELGLWMAVEDDMMIFGL